MLGHGRWFSPGSPASSTTKTGRHDITEILLKVALSTKNQSIIDYFYNISIYTIPEQALPQYQIVIVWCLDLKLPVQPVPITTNVVSSNPTQTRQHYVTHGRWFSLGTPVSSTNKTDHHNITEILLKVALSTINLNVI